MFSIPAQAAVINSIIVHTLLAGIFFFMWRVDRRENALRYWAAAYAASALRALFRQVGLSGYPSAIFGEALFGALAVVLIWMGAREFAGKPFASPGKAGAAAMAGMGGVAGLAASGAIPTVVPYLIGGGVFIFAGMALLKRGRETPGIGYGIVGFLFALYGGYVLAFSPLILQTGDPKSYILGPILNLAIGMVLLVVSQRKLYFEAEKLNAALLREAEGRRAAEDVGIRSEQRYRAIVDTARSMIGLLAPDGTVLDINRKAPDAGAIRGEDVIGRPFWETPWWAHDAEQQQRLRQAVRRVAAGGHDRFEATYPASDGGLGYFDFFLTPIRDADGQVVYLVPEGHDITELKRIELHLHAAEQRFRAISEGSMLGVFVTDPAGKTVKFSRRATEITGITEAEAIEGQAGRRLHSDDLAPQKAQWRQAIAERKPFVSERRFVRRDGSISWGRIHVAPILEGEDLLGFVGTIEDINARKQSEQALRESEERFSNFFALSPEPFAVTRYPDGEYVQVNEAWECTFGYRQGEVVGRSGLELGLWENPDDSGRLYEDIVRRKQARSGDIRLRRRNGESVIVQMSARVVAVGKAKYILWGSHDVTDRRRIQREIEDINLKLEARVQERTSKLERANAELGETLASLRQAQSELVRAEKLAALGSLVAGVAHELNTPIGNSVIVASTLQEKTQEFGLAVASGKLKRSVLDGYLEDARTASEMLLHGLSQANELVSSFKQVAVDQASAQRRRFDLRLVVEEVSSTLAPMLRKTPFKLELDLADSVVMDSYPGSIGQVITNLVTNSLAHAFEGRDHGLMQLKAWRRGLHRVEMTFADDGAGIPESDMKRVFDPFFTTKLGRGGSGLGLPIVYNLVTRVLGGRIEVASQPGAGARFQISLPMKAPDRTEREP